MKWLERICGLLVAIAAQLWLIFLVLYEGVLSTGFLMWRYKTAYDTAEGLHMTEEDLRGAVRNVLRLMKGKSADYEFTAIVKGETVTFLNPKEIDHMRELTELLGSARGFLLLTTLVAVAALALLWYRQKFGRTSTKPETAKTRKTRKTKNRIRFAKQTVERGLPGLMSLRLAQGLLASFALLLLTGSAMGVAALLDLREFVVWLHRVFFKGESWVLNSATDRLMHLCPLGLFRDGLLLLGGYFVLFVLAGTGLALKRLAECQKH